jgi:hypothetical protein
MGPKANVVNAKASVSGGGLEQAIDAYWRAASQVCVLPLTVCDVFKGKGVETLDTTTFEVPQVRVRSSRHRLVLTGPLTPGMTYARLDESLPASAVTFQPAVLDPGESEFRLLIEASALHGHPGAAYWGEVAVMDDATGQEIPPRVVVWLVVS